SLSRPMSSTSLPFSRSCFSEARASKCTPHMTIQALATARGGEPSWRRHAGTELGYLPHAAREHREELRAALQGRRSPELRKLRRTSRPREPTWRRVPSQARAALRCARRPGALVGLAMQVVRAACFRGTRHDQKEPNRGGDPEDRGP